VAADVVVNRNTITEMISHAIPVSSNTHHGPASRHRRARTQDLLSRGTAYLADRRSSGPPKSLLTCQAAVNWADTVRSHQRRAALSG